MAHQGLPAALVHKFDLSKIGSCLLIVPRVPGASLAAAAGEVKSLRPGSVD